MTTDSCQLSCIFKCLGTRFSFMNKVIASDDPLPWSVCIVCLQQIKDKLSHALVHESPYINSHLLQGRIYAWTIMMIRKWAAQMPFKNLEECRACWKDMRFMSTTLNGSISHVFMPWSHIININVDHLPTPSYHFSVRIFSQILYLFHSFKVTPSVN